MKFKYYFGIASPFSYLGNPRIFDMEKELGITWELKPYAIKEPGGPDDLDPNHRKYMRVDLQRLSEFYNLPIKFDKKKVPNGRPSLEFFFIANDFGKGREYILAASHAFWALSKDIDDPDILAQIALSVGLNEKEYKKNYEGSALKELLKRSIEEGDAEGIFGVPSLIIDDEIFWGQDRIHLARAKLNKILKNE